ncbi:MAG: CDP-alcohol phosphatidyltransferase family protein [Dehalococcoidia bacterium]
MASVYDGVVSRYLNRWLSRPAARALSHTSVSPNLVSLGALAVACGAFASFVVGLPILGGVLAQSSSIVDGVDGDLARITGKASAFGGFFDAVLDRYADGLIILGLTIWAADGAETRVWIAGVWAIVGALTVSYTRARIEGVPRTFFDRGLTSLASRDIRLLVVMIGSVVGQGFITLVVLAGVTNLVVLMRLVAARSALAPER